MSDNPERKDKPRPERRVMVRYVGKAETLVVRDSDTMRFGLHAELRDISVTGLGIVMQTSLDVNEQVKLTLTNEIQRVKKEARGTVRHVTSLEDGSYQIGIELTARLTPMEVSLLKMAIPRDETTGEQLWL